MTTQGGQRNTLSKQIKKALLQNPDVFYNYGIFEEIETMSFLNLPN